MLWLVMEEGSYQIISCNTHKEGELYQLWVERPNHKSLKIIESNNMYDVQEAKDAIDYAIGQGHKVLELK